MEKVATARSRRASGKQGRCDMRALDQAELDAVAGARVYDLGFGMYLFNMGDYWLFYTDAKGPVIQT